MDAFKLAEIQRMESGGNEPWKQFFDAHSSTLAEGRTFEDSTVKERYSGEVGEEWKERLSAKVEGREYVPVEKTTKKSAPSRPGAGISRSNTTTPRGFGSDSPGLGREPLSRSKSVAGGGGSYLSKKEQNEAYFGKMGELNASRSETLPPSEGGKFTGFGGGMPVESTSRSGDAGGIPGLDDFQSDPVAALTRGFGWFTTTVGKGAKTMNDTYIQPAAKTLAESDLAAHARLAATEVTRNIQTGTRTAADSFNRFVEGSGDPGGHYRPSGSTSTSSRGFEPERKDFWDSFAALGEERERQTGTGIASGSGSGAIGTGTMKKTHSSVSSSAKAAPSAAPKDDGWDDNW
ncbi:ADP-ribosylation factor GTPase-activating protein gcs1 [Microsporum ferrugineum]